MRVTSKLLGYTAVLNNLETVRDQASVDSAWVVGTNVEYSVYVEFGTSRMAAQPYLRPAVERAKRKLDTFAAETNSLADLIKTIALYIEREAKKLCPVDTGNLRASITAQKR